jgi:hypothetical protein
LSPFGRLGRRRLGGRVFGCLMANFFETSIALGASKSPALAKTLNLIAGIDILLMVAYFGVLLALRAAVLGPAAILPFLRGRDPRRKPGDAISKSSSDNSGSSYGVASASASAGAAAVDRDGPVRVAGTVALAVAATVASSGRGRSTWTRLSSPATRAWAARRRLLPWSPLCGAQTQTCPGWARWRASWRRGLRHRHAAGPGAGPQLGRRASVAAEGV